ncbi:MAG: cytochrome c biogenesis CcdA family protein [Armatimonadota bacterium]
MEWIKAATEYAKTAFESVGLGPMAFPLALLLGLASAVASACCTLPVLGAIVAYSGTREGSDKRTNLLSAAFFMLGTVIALVILGSVAGYVGQVAQTVLGKYWKLFAGVVALVMGLGALNLLPFKLPHQQAGSRARPQGLWGAAVFGVVLGGAVSACSLACNPGIFIILGVAVLQGATLWMLGVLVAYAIGFSLPLTAVVLGASFGKSAVKAQKAETAIRIVAGVLLIVAGFYFLKTF